MGGEDARGLAEGRDGARRLEPEGVFRVAVGGEGRRGREESLSRRRGAGGRPLRAERQRLRAPRPAGSLPGAGGAAPLPRHVGRAVASRRKGGAGLGRREVR